MPVVPSGKDLARMLAEHRVGVLSAWIDALFGLRDGHYRDYSPDTVRAWASAALRAAAGAMVEEDHEPVRSRAIEVSRVLSEHGFTIQQVIEGLLLLRQVVEPFLRRAYGKNPETLAGAVQGWDAGQRRLLGMVAAAFASEMLRDVEQAQRRTALMLAAAETSGSSLDLQTVYARVAADIAAAMPADYFAVFEGDDREEIYSFRASAGDLPDERLRQILTRPLRPTIDPLVRRTLQNPESGPQQSREKDPFLGQTTCRALQINEAYLIPIATPDRVQALILCIDIDKPMDAPSSISDHLEVAWGIAQTVAPAVSNARLHAETEQQLRVSRSLQKMSEAILSRRSSAEVMTIICTEARALVHCGGTAVYEVTGGGDDATGGTGWPLREIARAGTLPDSFPEAIPALAPAVLQSARQEPVLLTDLAGHAALGPRNAIRSLMVLRLQAGAEVVGALVLVDRERDFTLADVRHVRLFADQGAIALEHARMSIRQEGLALVEERQRLARDLHDSVSQSLYGLTMYAEAASRSLEAGATDKAVSHLKALRDTSLDVLREMRLLIFDLRPTMLAEEGLEQALQSRLSAVEGRCGVHTELRIIGVGDLPQRVEESLYGIACEALNNILKHAKASIVHVHLEQQEQDLALEIGDNGVGFDLDAGRRSGGYGLRSLRERAEAIGATLKLSSQPGKGTRIGVRLDRSCADSKMHHHPIVDDGGTGHGD